ncbi:beta-1,3-galactosyltransferase brn-like [Mizuhopecten yessoensis]|uniref:Hexosyltransferase n=1 Tax=Mizuhopecten yessoensis TaxID=6573 RepID=A0A210QHS8_MIZYE|nr:beta-1,3-galactosyltransferase brn-like [Mizuhopecten yessoensis]OWF48290.1 Beta-1,3-galactosyltransferase brn [Mizuhopecten yessoensis]
MSLRFGRYICCAYRRLGIVGIYFTCVYFLIVYLLLISIDNTLHIDVETTRNIPIQTTALATSTPMPVTTIFPSKTYYMEIGDYPLAFDIKSFVEDTIQEHDLTNYSDIAPINPRQFTYVYRARKCRFDPKVKHKLLILVKSAAGNRDWRRKIRKTWGAEYSDGKTIKIVFLLAATEEETQVFVDYEARKFRDIVQENFLDSYRNNTYKTIMGYNWAMEFCPTASYVLFIDDDIRVNVDKLTTHIDDISRQPQQIIDNLYIGLLIPCGEPYRDNISKWYISYDEYPHEFWPPYLAGGAFLMSHMSALKFQLAIPYVTLVSIDDSYLGIVAKKLGIRPIDSLMYHSSGVYASLSIFQHQGKSSYKRIDRDGDTPFTSHTKLCFIGT